MNVESNYYDILDDNQILELNYYGQELHNYTLLRYHASTDFDRDYYTKKLITAANNICQIMENTNE